MGLARLGLALEKSDDHQSEAAKNEGAKNKIEHEIRLAARIFTRASRSAFPFSTFWPNRSNLRLKTPIFPLFSKIKALSRQILKSTNHQRENRVSVGKSEPLKPPKLCASALDLEIAMFRQLFAIGALISATLLPFNARADVPANFSQTTLASGLDAPTALRFAPDGRLFICEQAGRLRILKNGALLPTPFVTVSTERFGERGLLGVAFDPSFASNRWIYLYYTVIEAGGGRHNRVSRFRASQSNPDLAESGSEQIIFELPALSSASNHNGGALAFGRDGKLLVAVGENAQPEKAQNLGSLFGKMLRLNPDGTIPTDNPFYSQNSGQNRAIWALGLRNPFTFAVQRTTGRIFINDVGQSTWEEINDGRAGANYGWPQTEGATDASGISSPFFSYGRNDGCAITGGAFYNPARANFPEEFVGAYFYADLCKGDIRVLDTTTRQSRRFAGYLINPVGLETGPDGALYYLEFGGGRVGRISYTQDLRPVPGGPLDVRAMPGQNARFEVTALGVGPFTYRWQRTNDGGKTYLNLAPRTPVLTLENVQLADSGARFRAIIGNAYGTRASRAAKLTVSSNLAPIPQILAPRATWLYSGGQSIVFRGSATDAEDGTLAPNAFTWRVDFHHDTHFHPFLPSQNGISEGTFVVPNRGETALNVWYRIHLTVRDSQGLTATTTRDIFPRIVNFSFQTNIPGVPIFFDGQNVPNPVTIRGVSGLRHSLRVPETFQIGATTYVFQSWTNGRARKQEITFPLHDAKWTATYAIQSSGASNGAS